MKQSINLESRIGNWLTLGVYCHTAAVLGSIMLPTDPPRPCSKQHSCVNHHHNNNNKSRTMPRIGPGIETWVLAHARSAPNENRLQLLKRLDHRYWNCTLIRIDLENVFYRNVIKVNTFEYIEFKGCFRILQMNITIYYLNSIEKWRLYFYANILSYLTYMFGMIFKLQDNKYYQKAIKCVYGKPDIRIAYNLNVF